MIIWIGAMIFNAVLRLGVVSDMITGVSSSTLIKYSLPSLLTTTYKYSNDVNVLIGLGGLVLVVSSGVLLQALVFSLRT